MWGRIDSKRELLERLLVAGAGRDLLCEYLGQGGDEHDLNRHRSKEDPVESGRQRCNCPLNIPPQFWYLHILRPQMLATELT